MRWNQSGGEREAGQARGGAGARAEGQPWGWGGRQGLLGEGQTSTLPHHQLGRVGSTPLSGWAFRMPSAVWKAWKELGKSTSGSDSSTSPSSMSTASMTVILL